MDEKTRIGVENAIQTLAQADRILMKLPTRVAVATKCLPGRQRTSGYSGQFA